MSIVDFQHEWAQRNATWTRWSDVLPPEDIRLWVRHPRHAGDPPGRNYVRRGDDLFAILPDDTLRHLFGPYDILEWTRG